MTISWLTPGILLAAGIGDAKNAATDTLKADDGKLTEILSINSLPLLVGTIAKGIISILGIIMVIYIFYAGFVWLTAGGDEDKVKKAKGIIKNSVIGLIIVLASYSVASYLIGMITTSSS